ncbi:hypothetical protein [Bacillus sp. RIT 809]|uniref:hypothetical protein n=1 Tax=Bacillus sp. RIT 809 TaxID=2803857 RepID=UPI0019518BD2|nr:hypothetical protein [Bacillus sp. RIT 809]MBM6648976.1 hypothetical protein [Bacillus sp. RIT 809]
MKIPELILNLFTINKSYKVVTIDEHTCEPRYTYQGTVLWKDEDGFKIGTKDKWMHLLWCEVYEVKELD